MDIKKKAGSILYTVLCTVKDREEMTIEDLIYHKEMAESERKAVLTSVLKLERKLQKRGTAGGAQY